MTIAWALPTGRAAGPVTEFVPRSVGKLVRSKPMTIVGPSAPALVFNVQRPTFKNDPTSMLSPGHSIQPIGHLTLPKFVFR